MEKITIDYTAVATGKGGRNGSVKTDDGKLDFPVDMPKEIGGAGKHTNPEQLFAAGYAACFGGALASVAKGKDVSNAEITVKASIGKSDKGGFGLAAAIEVKIPGMDKSEAQQLVDAAHQACPYSKATRGNIEVTAKAI
ncbi:organic hydroperoxide resistance protein [Penaeicola halotolerans]|uniref:organic hydroperoxide resistance protein n=1 Tax=Penaeicola halotolerans TaxID=2793196 RepID=UPI001CF8E137|nr:organic hydroperoxide resistance protein [Penaeicola halotolerans]